MSALTEDTENLAFLEKLARRHHLSIRPSEREKMEAHGNPDEDYLFITLPDPGDGHNSGLKRAADLLLNVFGLSDEAAEDHLAGIYERDPSDVRRAISRVRDGVESESRPKFPVANGRLINAVAKDNFKTVADLKKLSPGALITPAFDVIKLLMRDATCDDPLVCIGSTKSKFSTKPLSAFKALAHKCPFIVPQPMTSTQGQTKKGHMSPKSDANTSVRSNLVFEPDKIPDKDIQASLLLFLSNYAPLRCVCDSGGKSLHGFFDVAGRPHAEKVRFMQIACLLGADKALWTLSQFARIPGGTRPAEPADGDVLAKPAKHQELLYLEPDAPGGPWRIGALEQWIESRLRILESQGQSGASSMIVWGVNSFPTTVPPESVILGNAWLRRTDIAHLISTAGAGKSVAMIQAAMAWALGLSYFGVRPPHPLRILLFSGEDDRVTLGQCRDGLLEHSDAITGQTLTAADLTPLDAMLRTEFSREHVGDRFHTHLARLLTESPADLVIVNPLLSYVGGEIVACASNWLRAGLMPVLQQHDCAALLAHHTAKMAKDGWDNTDDTYSGIGGGEVANVPRTILVLRPTTAEGLAVVKVCKRKTTGWKDAEGNLTTSFFVMQSKDPERPAWIPVRSDQAREMINDSKVNGGTGNNRRKVTAEDVVEALTGGPMRRQELIEFLKKKCNCTENPAKDAIGSAEFEELISSSTEKNPKGGHPIKWFRVADDADQGPG